MHSCTSAKRLLHRFILLDTSLNILEAGAKLGCCPRRIAYEKPHLIAIFTQLSGHWISYGASSSNDQEKVLIHCFAPLLLRSAYSLRTTGTRIASMSSAALLFVINRGSELL